MADLLTTDARMEREPMANERAVADHLRTTKEKAVRLLLGEIARIADDYGLREAIDPTEGYGAGLADGFIWRNCIDAANAYSRGEEDAYFAELTKGYGTLSSDVPGLPNPTLHP